jgi:hypothetical protein
MTARLGFTGMVPDTSVRGAGSETDCPDLGRLPDGSYPHHRDFCRGSERNSPAPPIARYIIWLIAISAIAPQGRAKAESW